MYATRFMTRKQQFNVLLAESTDFFYANGLTARV